MINDNDLGVVLLPFTRNVALTSFTLKSSKSLFMDQPSKNIVLPYSDFL